MFGSHPPQHSDLNTRQSPQILTRLSPAYLSFHFLQCVICVTSNDYIDTLTKSDQTLQIAFRQYDKRQTVLDISMVLLMACMFVV